MCKNTKVYMYICIQYGCIRVYTSLYTCIQSHIISTRYVWVLIVSTRLKWLLTVVSTQYNRVLIVITQYKWVLTITLCNIIVSRETLIYFFLFSLQYYCIVSRETLLLKVSQFYCFAQKYTCFTLIIYVFHTNSVNVSKYNNLCKITNY